MGCKRNKRPCRNILRPGAVTELTTLILANALYFNGVWDEKFNDTYANERDFYLLNGGNMKVPFMASNSDQCISSYDGFKVLRLPYRVGEDWQRHFPMHIYLSDTIDGLSSLVDRISSEPGFLERYKATQVRVGDLLIPKFKISLGFAGSKILNDLGVPTNNSEIYHKSFIEVNEEGTEAAGATVYVECGDSEGSPPRPKKILNFVADHPFLFILTEVRSGVVLLMGTVLNTLTSDQE